VLVPHLKDRPFTMKRYPDGWNRNFFFQKDAPTHMPEWIPTFRTQVSTREKPRVRKWVSFPLVNDELALLWMVNMGCIDMNTWYSRVDKPTGRTGCSSTSIPPPTPASRKRCRWRSS
jgi:bifunctional non-homologous end joining protein LigD